MRFIRTLAGGRLDLGIYGFHGSDFLAIPWYWLTHSESTQIDYQRIWAILIPMCAYFAASGLFGSKRDALLFTGIIMMMPFMLFTYLMGWTFSSYTCLIFLTIAGVTRGSSWTWVPWGFAIITKPFALALLPLILLCNVKRVSRSWRVWTVVLAFLIPAAYVVTEYLQIGTVHMGVHRQMHWTTFFLNIDRFFLNWAHALQMMFSVHNFNFAGYTGSQDLMHTTPVLIFLSIFGFLAPKQFYKERRMPLVLLLCAVFGLSLNAMLHNMDHLYMHTGILFLLLGSIPVLRKHLLWIPLVLATLHFQWLYYYLYARDRFDVLLPLETFLLIPVVIDLTFLVVCIWYRKKIWNMLKNAWVW
jgi:hypothetical protein